jgi:hypothetical protein
MVAVEVVRCGGGGSCKKNGESTELESQHRLPGRVDEDLKEDTLICRLYNRWIILPSIQYKLHWRR